MVVGHKNPSCKDFIKSWQGPLLPLLLFLLFLLYFGTTSGNAQRLLLVLLSGIIPGGTQGTDYMGFWGWDLDACKGNILPTGLSLQSKDPLLVP